MPDEEFWYRAFFRAETKVVDISPDGDILGWLNKPKPHVSIFYDRFPVLKHTPQGVWLATAGGKRFVLRDARKRWACPTKEEALESLRARTARRQTILKAQLRDVTIAMEALTCESNETSISKSSTELWRTFQLSSR